MLILTQVPDLLIRILWRRKLRHNGLEKSAKATWLGSGKLSMMPGWHGSGLQCQGHRQDTGETTSCLLLPSPGCHRTSTSTQVAAPQGKAPPPPRPAAVTSKVGLYCHMAGFGLHVLRSAGGVAWAGAWGAQGAQVGGALSVCPPGLRWLNNGQGNHPVPHHMGTCGAFY